MASIASCQPAALKRAGARTLALVLAMTTACPVGRAVTVDFRVPVPEGETSAVKELPYTESGFMFNDVFGSTAYVITTNEQPAPMDSFLAMAWSESVPSEIRVRQEANALFSLAAVDYSHLGSGRLQFTSSKGGSFETPQLGSSGKLTFRTDPLWRGITSFSITGLRGDSGSGEFSEWNEALFPSMVLIPALFRYSGGPGVWSGTTNWVGNAQPRGDDAAVSFVGPGGLAVNDLPPVELGKLYSLNFSSSAGAYVVGSLGATRLAVGEGGVRNESSTVQTIATDLTFDDQATIDAGPAGIDFVGPVSLQADVIVDGAGITRMASITGIGGLTKTGSGTLQLVSDAGPGQTPGSYSLKSLDVEEGVLELGPTTTVAVDQTLVIGPIIDALHVTLGKESASRQAAVTVNGRAFLYGPLKVSLEPGFTPAVGDRFGIVAADEILNRFRAFEAPVISGTSFLGLNYQRALGKDKGTLAEVITLEAPRAVAGGHLTGKTAENLVLVVHGFNSRANTFIPFAKALDGHATQDADIAVLDWSSFAKGDKYPQSAAENAVNIGEALGEWLKDRGISGYRNVQLMGHSAGTWLVNSLAGKIKQHSSQTNIQMTLFDSYVPPGVFMQDSDDLTISDIGQFADFVEQYFHDGSLPWTQAIMPRAINIDVTAQEPEGGNILTAHDFPYHWYADSASRRGDPRYGGLGYELSVLVTGLLPSHAGNFAQGGILALSAPNPDDPDNWDLVQKVITLQPLINPLTSAPVTTGDVVVDAIGATLRTNSPAMLTILADIVEPANGFRFDMAFQNDALGNLAVYLDGMLLSEWSNESFVGLTGLFDSGWISTGDLAIGPHTLLFRLDNLTDTQSILRIENVTFGKLVATPVPEPSTWVLGAGGIACAAWSTVRRRRGGYSGSGNEERSQLAV